MAGMLERVRIQGSTNVVASGATTVRSTIIDMSGADGCLFICHETSLGTAATTGATATLQVKGSTGNSTGSMVALRPSGSTIASTGGMISVSDVGTAGNFDQSVYAIDVVKPVAKRYLMLTAENFTGIGTITAVRYNVRKGGSTSFNANTTFVNASTTVVGPASS